MQDPEIFRFGSGTIVPFDEWQVTEGAVMDFVERESGIVVPKQPETVNDRRKYGGMEIHTQGRREKVSEALLQLWDALDLSHWRHLNDPVHAEQREDHMRLYRFVGESLLGDECPQRVEYT